MVVFRLVLVVDSGRGGGGIGGNVSVNSDVVPIHFELRLLILSCWPHVAHPYKETMYV